MNYYEHHIGDYAEATSHLTFIEDATYIRLLHKYYATEKPLPAEIASVQRLIKAKTKEEKSSVVTILKEYFSLSDDGWRQTRCDHEITRFKAKQLKAKRSAEGRWQAEQLNQTETQTTIEIPCERNAIVLPTHCSPDTSNQTPETSHQKPISIPQENRTMGVPGVLRVLGVPGAMGAKEEKKSLSQALATEEEKLFQERIEKHKSFAAMICKEGRAIAIDDYRIREMVDLGVTEDEVSKAIVAGKETRRKAANPNPINAGFILAILKGSQKKPDGSDLCNAVWWQSHQGIDAKGRELGMTAEISESYETFKARIFTEIHKRKNAIGGSDAN